MLTDVRVRSGLTTTISDRTTHKPMSLEKRRGKKRTVMGASSSSSSSAPLHVSSPLDSPGFVHSVPLDIVEEIFHNLPHDQVVQCRLVCKQWKEVADSDCLWRERCRREGFWPCNMTPDDWRIYYVLCKRRRNLLKNPRAEENLQYWHIVSNGGDNWVVEKLIQPHPNPEVQKNFVTSYAMCLKSQEIDLKSEGYNSSFMDQYQPPIKITDWYASRCDCLYKIQVELLNRKKKCIHKFGPKIVHIEEQNNHQWYSMTHEFRNYGPGVRYIRFMHGGKDCIFWAGWYGVRVTDSCVEVCPQVE